MRTCSRSLSKARQNVFEGESTDGWSYSWRCAWRDMIYSGGLVHVTPKQNIYFIQEIDDGLNFLKFHG